MSRRYRFGPLERRGVVGPLRAGQVLVLALAAGAGLISLYAVRGWPGLGLALALTGAGAAAALLPVDGRTAEEWAPVVLRWALRSKEGREGYRSESPALGHRQSEDGLLPSPSLPEALRGLRLLEAPYGPDVVGVVHDPAAGSYTAALAVRAGAFGLSDGAEQERKLDAWGSVLAGLARDGSPVSRLQWVERTLPAPGDDLAAYLQAERDRSVPLDSEVVSSYIELIESAAPAATEHQILIALQVTEAKAGRDLRRFGGGQEAACELLLREAESLAEGLSLAEVTVFGLLRPSRYAEAIRDGFDPFGRQARGRAALADGGREGVAPALMGPMAAEAGWSHYRSDSAYHRAYWISSWPRSDVGASFLAPLLMQTTALRTVSVTIEPIAQSTAVRRAEAARTAEVAEEIQRERQGFLTTAQVRRRQQAATRREEELADGHAELRVAGFVIPCAPTLEALERGCPDVVHAALLARLELQPLYGEQAAGHANGLPLCWGLR